MIKALKQNGLPNYSMHRYFLGYLKSFFLGAGMMETPKFLYLIDPQKKPRPRENNVTSAFQRLAEMSQTPSWDHQAQWPCPPWIYHLMLLLSSWQIPTHLWLSNHGWLSVTERRKRQPQLGFSVTLEKHKVTVNKRTVGWTAQILFSSLNYHLGHLSLF